jgi:hypothetical protein
LKVSFLTKIQIKQICYISTSLFSFYAMALPLDGWRWRWPITGEWTASFAAAAAAYVAAVKVAVVVAPLFGG